MIAAGPVVDETDDLIPELAVLKNLFRNHASQISRAGNQDPLQADPGLPSPLENFADEFARAERQHDVDHEEQRPDDARDLIRANRLFLRRSVIRVDIQRGHDAENDRDDGADENQEEVVDPGPAAAQAVYALRVVRNRHQDGDERHHRDVLGEWRVAARDGNQTAPEPEQVGEAERGNRQ